MHMGMSQHLLEQYRFMHNRTATRIRFLIAVVIATAIPDIVAIGEVADRDTVPADIEANHVLDLVNQIAPPNTR